SLRDAIRQHKAELLALLAPPWDQAEAARLVASVQTARQGRFGGSEWPADPAACQKLAALFDQIDNAWLDRNRLALEAAVKDTLALIRHGDPRPLAALHCALRRHRAGTGLPVYVTTAKGHVLQVRHPDEVQAEHVSYWCVEGAAAWTSLRQREAFEWPL